MHLSFSKEVPRLKKLRFATFLSCISLALAANVFAANTALQTAASAAEPVIASASGVQPLIDYVVNGKVTSAAPAGFTAPRVATDVTFDGDRTLWLNATVDAGFTPARMQVFSGGRERTLVSEENAYGSDAVLMRASRLQGEHLRIPVTLAFSSSTEAGYRETQTADGKTKREAASVESFTLAPTSEEVVIELTRSAESKVRVRFPVAALARGNPNPATPPLSNLPTISIELTPRTTQTAMSNREVALGDVRISAKSTGTNILLVGVLFGERISPSNGSAGIAYLRTSKSAAASPIPTFADNWWASYYYEGIFADWGSEQPNGLKVISNGPPTVVSVYGGKITNAVTLQQLKGTAHNFFLFGFGIYFGPRFDSTKWWNVNWPTQEFALNF